ncbi:MAG: carbon-nitrogen hydrolase family protein [Thermoanaerobaculia bacterium]|nr:MAG: carbon-nitrogen hydrolase family protein [Thermoanaerobaculia bacterium]
MRDEVRVAAIQYYVRPVDSFDRFAAQVSALVATAADYKADLVVFPEYFTVQLLTLGDLGKPIREQVRDLAAQVPAFLELMSGLARRYGVHLVAGSIPGRGDNGELHNDCHVFGPGGGHAVQGKLHMTRWEREEWMVSPRRRLRVIETPFGRMAVAICYDVEFPEIARAAARRGCDILVVPSCTDDRQGFLRVRYCAQARAIENQMFVIQACTVGSLPMVPAVSLNYGQASILTPSDFTFSRDGILAEGAVNSEMMVIGVLRLDDLRASRETGTVLPLRDSQTTAEVLSELEEVVL